MANLPVTPTSFPGLFPLKLGGAPPNFNGKSPGNAVAVTRQLCVHVNKRYYYSFKVFHRF